jgi:thiol-disulfide isomerase/thioredoxin
MHVTKKTIFTLILVCGLLLTAFASVFAQSDTKKPEVVITLFWRVGCQHCEAEIPFLKELASQYPQIAIKGYEVVSSNDNLEYFLALGKAMGFDTSGVPVTVIGDQVWTGYDDATGEAIRAAVQGSLETGSGDPAQKYGLDTSKTIQSTDENGNTKSSSGYSVWVIVAVAIVIVSFVLGMVLGKKKKPVKKAKKH